MKETNHSYEKEAFKTLVNELAQTESINEENEENKEEYIELARLNLPPRSDVHQTSSYRLTIPSEHPLTRFLIACMFILSVCVVVYVVLGDQFFDVFK